MRRELALRAVALALWTLSAVGAAGAAGDGADAADRGELLYRVHCRSCHGAGATGDGPMAELLKVEPADLTRLAEDNDGKFDAAEVHAKIDGREEVRAHGSSEMPIWGLTFRDPGLDAAQEAPVRKRISDLVTYLASIQGRLDETPSDRP